MGIILSGRGCIGLLEIGGIFGGQQRRQSEERGKGTGGRGRGREWMSAECGEETGVNGREVSWEIEKGLMIMRKKKRRRKGRTESMGLGQNCHLQSLGVLGFK